MPQQAHVTELFYSIQGENIHTGTPSIFVRLFGCNLKCEGFGMSNGEKSIERKTIAENMINFTTIEDVPLSTTGCDSFVAWDKKYRHLSKLMSVNELCKNIVNLLPEHMNGLFVNGKRVVHLIFTGGEPMLQQNYINDVVRQLEEDNNLNHVTIETNGTKKIKDLNIASLYVDWTLSVSPKLKSSGETDDKRSVEALLTQFNSQVINDYSIKKTKLALKFVTTGSQDDLDEIESIISVIDDTSRLSVSLMPTGGCYEEYQQNAVNVANVCLEQGYRYSPRLHIDLYKNTWGT